MGDDCDDNVRGSLTLVNKKHLAITLNVAMLGIVMPGLCDASIFDKSGHFQHSCVMATGTLKTQLTGHWRRNALAWP